MKLPPGVVIRNEIARDDLRFAHKARCRGRREM